METKAIRVFYRKPDNQIIWLHELNGIGEFPTTIEQDLVEIPNKIISREFDADGNIVSEIEAGGLAEDYACIEEYDQKASNILASDDNIIVEGELTIGAKRAAPEPMPSRDLSAEIDELKAQLAAQQAMVSLLESKYKARYNSETGQLESLKNKADQD